MKEDQQVWSISFSARKQEQKELAQELHKPVIKKLKK